MSGILSANPAVRRREEALLERARMDAIDAKLDTLVTMGGAQASPTPPVVDPRITTLARAMGHRDYQLPTGAIASLTFDDDGEIIATGLTIEGRFWSISDIVKLQLIDHRGAWLWHRYSAIAMALPPVNNDYLRPHYAATMAGRPSL
jgi:hypothetical protein